MRMLARISALAACAGWLLGAAGIAGAHQTALAPMTGFAMFLVGVACAATALMAGLAALGASFARGPRSARPAAATAVVVAALAVVPAALALSRWMRIAHPPLCDVTTDIANPPQFLDAHGAPLAAMQYDRRLSPIQLRYYPALAPLRLDETPDRAFARVERAAGAPHAAGPIRAGASSPSTRRHAGSKGSKPHGSSVSGTTSRSRCGRGGRRTKAWSRCVRARATGGATSARTTIASASSSL